MALNYAAFDGGMVGTKTASANTVIVITLPPSRTSSGIYRGYTRLAALSSTQGNTANSNYLMRPIGRTTTSAASNSGVNTVTLTADPGATVSNNIAANDYVSVMQSDGTILTATVNAWNGTTKVATLNSNTTAAVSSGAKVWFYGIQTDTDPVTGAAHPILTTTANATTTWNSVGGGIRGAQVGDPLLIYNPNATNASTINYAEYAHVME